MAPTPVLPSRGGALCWRSWLPSILGDSAMWYLTKAYSQENEGGNLRTFVRNDSRAQLSTMCCGPRPQQMFSGGVSFGGSIQSLPLLGDGSSRHVSLPCLASLEVLSCFACAPSPAPYLSWESVYCARPGFVWDQVT